MIIDVLPQKLPFQSLKHRLSQITNAFIDYKSIYSLKFGIDT